MDRLKKLSAYFGAIVFVLFVFFFVGEYLLCSFTSGQWVFKTGVCDYPEPSSQIFTRNQQQAMIHVDAPIEGSVITSPLKITGQARGTWFFEASFPVVLVDWDGKIIAQGIAQAQSDWMTESFVPFSAELTFVKPTYSNKGALILKKDNPSGLPENAGSIEIPILFAP